MTVRRRTVRDERGAALVEFAIVLPVLVMILLGVLTGGITLNRRMAVTNAVREGSRYGATLPVASAPACASSTPYLNCWLAAVAGIVQQAAEGELASSVSTSVICVAYVYPAGTTTTDSTRRLVRTAGVDVITSGSTCFDDARPSGTERRVQVTGQRQGRIEFLLGTLTPTLLSRSVTRYEAG